MAINIFKVMKRFVLLLSILCLTSVVSWPADDGETQFIPIRVLDDVVETGRTHRSARYVPIEAYYTEALSSIQISFLQDVGEVKILINNLTECVSAEYYVNSGSGTIMLPMDGEHGAYYILILSSGAAYEGEFVR